MDELYSTRLQIYREDDLDGIPTKFEIPPGAEFDEVKDKLFAQAYPGNGDTPLECRLLTIGLVEVDDINILIAIPEGKIVVSPGESFKDKTGKKKVANREEKEREKAEKLREKEEKEREKAERQKEKEKEKEERQREKEREKEEKQKEKEERLREKEKEDANRRGSLFKTMRSSSGSLRLKLRSDSTSSANSDRSSSQKGDDEDDEPARADSSKVYFKGYLHKKNEVLAGGKVPNRNWISYWVVLRSKYLLFYKERKHYTAQKKPIGGINIQNCELEPVFDHKKREHVFRLRTNKEASYLMQAESLEEMSAWLNYIEQASKYVPSQENPGTPKAEELQEAFEEETEPLKSGEDDDDTPVVHKKLSPQEEEELAKVEAVHENGRGKIATPDKESD